MWCSWLRPLLAALLLLTFIPNASTASGLSAPGLELLPPNSLPFAASVTVDASGRVTRFREKPTDPQSGLASIALYFLPARTWELLERYLDGGGNRDAPGHFFAWLVRETEVYAEPIAGKWWDIGDLDSLADARANASR